MNTAIQFFTFDQTRQGLRVLRALEVLLVDAAKAKVVWSEHDGTRRRAQASKVIDPSAGCKLNEAYIQASLEDLGPDFSKLKPLSLILHLSISPTSEAWASSSGIGAFKKPKLRKVTSYVRSLERAAAFRAPQPMATVLEMTLSSDIVKSETLKDIIGNVVAQSWPLMDCSDKFATADWGGPWLFFPKSGYNPNVSELHAYYSTEACKDWNTWRKAHNLSFGSLNQTGNVAEMVVHKLDPQIQENANETMGTP